MARLDSNYFLNVSCSDLNTRSYQNLKFTLSDHFLFGYSKTSKITLFMSKGRHTLGDQWQGLTSGTRNLVCTRILHRNSSRRDHTFGPCDQRHELSWFDFCDQSQGQVPATSPPVCAQLYSLFTQHTWNKLTEQINV